MDRVVITPSGKRITVPDNFTPEQELEVVILEERQGGGASAAPEAAVPEPPKGNAIQRGLDTFAQKLREGSGSPLQQAWPTLSGMARGLGAGAIETLAHPVENAPTLAAMAAPMGVGSVLARTGMQAARPIASAGLRALSSGLAGGTAAKLGGASTEEATLRGVGDMALQGVPDMLGAVLAKPLRSTGQSIFGSALKPTETTLEQLRDPLTGKQFGDFELAAKHFKARAPEIQPTGTPGKSTYRQGLTAQSEAAQRAKQELYTYNPQIRVPDDELTPPGMFDRMATTMTERGTTPAPEALAEANKAITQVLERSHAVPGAYTGATNMPIVTPPTRPTEWSLPELDRLQKGLQDRLNTYYKAKEAAKMYGTPMPNEAEGQALETLRNRVSELTAQYAPQLPGKATVAELNKQIQELIPYEQAAIQATMPSWAANVPRARVATTGQGAMPLRVQLFDYLGNKTAGAARPLIAAGKAVPKIGAGSPQLARLLSLLAPSHEQR